MILQVRFPEARKREAEAQRISQQIPRNDNKGSWYGPIQAKEAEAKEKERRREEAAKVSSAEINFRKCMIWIYQEASIRGWFIVVHFGNGIGKTASCIFMLEYLF